MPRFGVLSKIIVASLPAAFSIDALLRDPVGAGERIEPPAWPLVAQLQPGTSANRITSWFGYELKLIGPNRLGVFLEGGDLVDVKSCVCSGGEGSCRAVVAETPHYSFCARSRSNPCSGECKFE